MTDLAIRQRALTKRNRHSVAREAEPESEMGQTRRGPGSCSASPLNDGTKMVFVDHKQLRGRHSGARRILRGNPNPELSRIIGTLPDEAKMTEKQKWLKHT